MSRHNTTLVKAALAAAHHTGLDSALAPFTRGLGAIFMLHHVRPGIPAGFEPNRILTVTPEFLDDVIGQVRLAGFDTINLDEVPGRLAAGRNGRPFACFTLDDGYKDNREFAYPVFKRHNVPFAIYVATDFADGTGDLWWLVLEAALARAARIAVPMDGAIRDFVTQTDAQKTTAHHEIYWWLREQPEERARQVVAELARSVGFDARSLCSDLVMTWDELRDLALDPLVTIGAHTQRHMALGKLSAAEAEAEMSGSIARIERELGRPCRHFSYPYGCAMSAGSREFDLAARLGVATAVTTRKGLLQPHHGKSPTALPRFSLNGDYPDLRYTKVMLSGAPFALLKAMQRR